MATDEDKESACIRFDSETPIRSIRRPRMNQDGLFLFGRRHAAQLLVLGQATLDRLAEGRTVAVDVQRQYISYIQIPARPSSIISSPVEASTDGRRGRVTSEERVIAAQILLKLDRKDRRKTPEWIRRLAAEGDS
jgi:hypothetical protein